MFDITPRYDRDFLLQFMPICKEKPTTLLPLAIVGLDPTDQSPHHNGSGRQANSISEPSFRGGRGGPGRRGSASQRHSTRGGFGADSFRAQPITSFGVIADRKESTEWEWDEIPVSISALRFSPGWESISGFSSQAASFVPKLSLEETEVVPDDETESGDSDETDEIAEDIRELFNILTYTTR